MVGFHKMMATKTANGMYDYNAIVCDKTLDAWVQETHHMMSREYGWKSTPLKPGCFGYDNLVVSLAYCYERLLQSIEKTSVSLEEVSDFIHQGWILNYVYWRDHQPWVINKAYIKPAKALGDERRNMCASTAYNDLPEDEKQKDRLIAAYFLKHFQVYLCMRSKLDE